MFQVEISDTRGELEVMHEQHLKDREEIEQLTNLYKVSDAYICERELSDAHFIH